MQRVTTAQCTQPICVAFAPFSPLWQAAQRHDLACLHLLLHATKMDFCVVRTTARKLHSGHFVDQAVKRGTTVQHFCTRTFALVVWQANGECAHDCSTFKNQESYAHCPIAQSVITTDAALGWYTTPLLSQSGTKRWHYRSLSVFTNLKQAKEQICLRLCSRVSRGCLFVKKRICLTGHAEKPGDASRS